VIKIKCIECGTEKEVKPGRGRPRYFCGDPCRVKAYRKEKGSDRVASEYAAKKRVIDKQYSEARRSSGSIEHLRTKAICDLVSMAWTVGNIAKLFHVSEQRIRKVMERK